MGVSPSSSFSQLPLSGWWSTSEDLEGAMRPWSTTTQSSRGAVWVYWRREGGRERKEKGDEGERRRREEKRGWGREENEGGEGRMREVEWGRGRMRREMDSAMYSVSDLLYSECWSTLRRHSTACSYHVCYLRCNMTSHLQTPPSHRETRSAIVWAWLCRAKSPI